MRRGLAGFRLDQGPGRLPQSAEELHHGRRLEVVEAHELAPFHDGAAAGMSLGNVPGGVALGRELALVRWGLVPHWAQDPAIGNRLLNARSETAAQKPSFRDAFRKRRCLIPATGFYEWQAAGRSKPPFHFRLADGRPFAFAGLWERWDKGEQPVESCTVLTTEANAVVRLVHERMPVILTPDDFGRWLDPAFGSPGALLRPFAGEDLVAVPVGQWVNDPRHEGAECLAPAV